MIFDWSATAALAAVQNIQPEAPLTLSGEGLWVCLVSSGTCTASLDDIGPSPAGSALILPPQNAPAGHLILSRSPLTLTPAGACHLLCLQLTGQAALQFLAGLPELPFLARGETCPAAAELMGQLAAETDDTPHSRARSQLAFALLCELSGANYLCRVFKKETGHSPAQWRAMAGQSLRPGLSPEESQREQELYI